MNNKIKMYQHFPEQTSKNAKKINERNSINFTKEIKNNNMNDKNNNSDWSKKSSSSSSDNPMDCPDFKKKESMLRYGHFDNIRDNNNIKVSSRSIGKSIFANENKLSKKTLLSLYQIIIPKPDLLSFSKYPK